MFKNWSKFSLLWAITSLFLLQIVCSNEVRTSKCLKTHPDGFEYHVSCPNSSSTIKEEVIPATDSEVPDLLEHKPTEKSSKTSSQVNEKIYSGHVEPLSAVDEIVKPKETLSTNSKFNIRTGGIAALVCVTIALVFYLGVMIWKQVVMSGYQNREILLNDDDIGDINDEDMRHFEAACIQIEA